MKAQVDYWNQAANLKTFTHDLDYEMFERLVEPTTSVLDIGCGYGRALSLLQSRGYNDLLGVDTSPQMIERGKREHPSLQLVPMLGIPLPLDSGSISACLLMAVLTCIPSNHDQTGLIQEILRLLKPGGTLWITDYWMQTDSRNQTRYLENRDEKLPFGSFQLPDGAIVRHHARDWINYLLGQFEVVSLSDCQFKTMNGNLSTGFRAVVRKPLPS